MHLALMECLDYRGVEKNRIVLRHLEQTVSSEHKHRFREIGFFGSVPYADDFFDAVVMSHVLPHVENHVLALLNIRRVLKPHGKLVMVNPGYLNESLRAPANFLKGYRSDPTIVRRWSVNSVRRALRICGFGPTEFSFGGEYPAGMSWLPECSRDRMFVVTQRSARYEPSRRVEPIGSSS